MRFSRSFVIGALLACASAGSVVFLAGCEDESKKSGTMVESNKAQDAQVQKGMSDMMSKKAAEAKK